MHTKCSSVGRKGKVSGSGEEDERAWKMKTEWRQALTGVGTLVFPNFSRGVYTHMPMDHCLKPQLCPSTTSHCHKSSAFSQSVYS